MGCDAQTVADLIAADKIPSLSDRDSLMCLVVIYATAAGVPNAQAAIDLAYQDGLAKLSDSDLDKAYLAAIC